MTVDKGLETIVVATGGDGMTVAAGRTPVEGWSGVGNREALERTEGLGVTSSEVECMEEMSSSS